MRQILEIEDNVIVPPMMHFGITYLIKEEIRKHKWIEGEKGRALSWPEARGEWIATHRKDYEKFLLDTLSFPDLVHAPPLTREANVSAEKAVAQTGARLSSLPHRAG